MSYPHGHRRLRVVGVRRVQPNYAQLARALLTMAREQLEAERRTAQQSALSPRHLSRTICDTMHDLSDDERKQVLGEVLMDELKAIREYVQDVPAIKADVAQLKEDVAELKSDMKVVKAAVTDHSHVQQKLVARISHLEAAA